MYEGTSIMKSKTKWIIESGKMTKFVKEMLFEELVE